MRKSTPTERGGQRERVRLRPLERDDLARAKAWVNDPEIAALVLRTLPVNMMEEERWFETVTLDPSKIVFALEETESGTHIGNAGLYDIDWINRKAEFWILLGEKKWRGRGLGEEATKRLLRFAFSNLNLNRVYLKVADSNKRAIRTYRRCGFRIEGTFRSDVFIEGCYRDTLRMALLRDEIEP